MDKKLIFPPKLLEDELFKEVVDVSFDFSAPYLDSFKDITDKYAGSDNLPQEAIDEILKEFGLESLSNLLAVSPVIDKHTILAYANAISLLKGTEIGYFLVLDLLNFSYTAVPWYDQSPKGVFNTFSFDVQLDASIIPEPYKTFQNIKQFTRDYLMMVIHPLGYTYFVIILGPAITMKGAVHQVRYGKINQTVDPSLVYGTSGWIIDDSNQQKWKIKVNGIGQLKAFRTMDQRDQQYAYMTDGTDSYKIVVSTTGEISTILEPGPNQALSHILLDSNGIEWNITVNSNGDLVVTS